MTRSEFRPGDLVQMVKSQALTPFGVGDLVVITEVTRTYYRVIGPKDSPSDTEWAVDFENVKPFKDWPVGWRLVLRDDRGDDHAWETYEGSPNDLLVTAVRWLVRHNRVPTVVRGPHQTIRTNTHTSTRLHQEVKPSRSHL